MKRICGWCNRELTDDNTAVGLPIPKEDQQLLGPVTHGICGTCKEEMMSQVQKSNGSNWSFGTYAAGRDKKTSPRSVTL